MMFYRCFYRVNSEKICRIVCNVLEICPLKLVQSIDVRQFILCAHVALHLDRTCRYCGSYSVSSRTCKLSNPSDCVLCSMSAHEKLKSWELTSQVNLCGRAIDR